MVGAAGSNQTPKVSIGVTAPLTYNADTGTLRANNFQIGIGSLSSDGEQISIVGNLNFSSSIDRAITVNGTQAGTVGKSLTIIAGGTTGGITNTNGGNLNLLSGSTTGTGISNINFSIPVIGPSGVTTINSRVDRMVVNNSGATITGNLILGTEAGKATLQYTTNQARTYTIPDAGTTANFVMTEGAQTINGAKTFSDLRIGSTADLALVTTTSGTVTTRTLLNNTGSPSALSTSSTSLVTEQTIAKGLVTVNNAAQNNNSLNAIYAPTSAGNSGQALRSSGGTSAPTWGTLGVSGGGTNLTTLTAAGRVLYASSASQVAVTAAGATGGFLISNATSAPTFTLSNELIGTSGAINSSTDYTIAVTGFRLAIVAFYRDATTKVAEYIVNLNNTDEFSTTTRNFRYVWNDGLSTFANLLQVQNSSGLRLRHGSGGTMIFRVTGVR